MDSFVVDHAEFFSAFPNLHNWPGIKLAMMQLVERYDLKSKDVLSVGGGSGTEEYWLWQSGCRLTIVDIDEWGAIRPKISAMRAVERGLTFHLGDAAEFFRPSSFAGLRIPLRRAFDVIYLSGFTPDEQRRWALMGQQWPSDADPFHPIVIEAARHLRRGGLLIVQSFGYGIDTVYHRDFFPAMQRQLAEISIDLLESFRFLKLTGVNLHVAQRRGGRKPPLKTPITQIHGRAEPEPIEQTWPR